MIGTTFDTSPITTPRRWHIHAICVSDPNQDAWTSGRTKDTAYAIERCELCPVRSACAEDGRGMRYGVWAGEWKR